MADRRGIWTSTIILGAGAIFLIAFGVHGDFQRSIKNLLSPERTVEFIVSSPDGPDLTLRLNRQYLSPRNQETPSRQMFAKASWPEMAPAKTILGGEGAQEESLFSIIISNGQFYIPSVYEELKDDDGALEVESELAGFSKIEPTYRSAIFYLPNDDSIKDRFLISCFPKIAVTCRGVAILERRTTIEFQIPRSDISTWETRLSNVLELVEGWMARR